MSAQNSLAALVEKYGLFPDGNPTLDEMNAYCGTSFNYGQWALNPQACYTAWYDALIQMYEAPAQALEPAGPRKPAPALPVEAHRTAEFDSAQAWNATLAACRGQR
jgi:hypothetical protein